MKRMLLICAVLSLCSCRETSHSLFNPALAIEDIRGDALGMTLTAYDHKHPYECTLAKPGALATCVGDETYAGMPALKGAYFTKTGKLWKITYGAKGWEAAQILTALEQRYGSIPGCAGIDGETCAWDNGKRRIFYSHLKDSANIDFTDQALANEFNAEYDQDQASAAKSDQ